MKVSSLAHLCVVLASTSAYALKLPFQRWGVPGAQLTSLTGPIRYTFGASEGVNANISNFNDLRYSTNITINGIQVTVALDTGSTDLWVIPPGGIGQFNDTGIPIELLYGDGSYGTQGTIGVAPFQLGSYVVPQQAFLNAVESTIGDLQDVGIYGLMGLSFDFASVSPINANIQSIYGEDATWGQSVLRNIFQQNPTEPNFIAIDLTRTDDMEDTSGGSFTIGEYVDLYAAVANQTQLPQWPKGGDRWTVLLEGIYVDNAAIDVQSTIPGVPAGQAQAMLDTGDPSSIFPVAIADAIYSRVPGSELYTDPNTHIWLIPCNTTTSVEFVFGGQRYPIHPLDLSTFSNPITDSDGQEYIACVSSFKEADNWGEGDFDISLGDTFLRNVYPLFDFGAPLPDGSTSDPFIQLLSKLDPAKAVGEVATIRALTMASMPPEIAPAALIQLLEGTASDPTPTPGDDEPPTPTDTSSVPDSTAAGAAADSRPPSPGNIFAADDSQVTLDESTVKKYGLIIIGLLAVNTIIGFVLVVFGVLLCVRKGSSRKASMRSSGPPSYVPVKAQDNFDEGYSGQYQKPYGQ